MHLGISDSLLRIGLVNFVADTTILYLVKRRMYPDKRMTRIAAGGFLSSLTYILWFCFHQRYSGSVMNLSAAVLIGILVREIFQIRSLPLLLATLLTGLFYTVLLGGGVLLAQGFFTTVPVRFRHAPDPMIPCLLSAAFLLLIRFVLGDQDLYAPSAGDNLYQVELDKGNSKVRCTGLYDSANLLKSQLTGEGILVISWKEGEKLLPAAPAEGKNPAGFIRDPCYYIEYQSVGMQDGVMPAVLVDRIVVRKNGKILVEKSGMVGICREPLSKDKRFSVLLPEDIFSCRSCKQHRN